MKKKLLLMLMLILFSIQHANSQPKREVRAVWLSTNYALDWPKTGRYWGTVQKDDLVKMLDKLQSININTIIFQVQCLGDVFWDSKIQPRSVIATKNIAGGPLYMDYCSTIVEECHKRNMEVHAWIVPYRLGSEANAARYDTQTSMPKHLSRIHPELCINDKTAEENWFLDPGNPEARKYLIDLYEELITTTSGFDGINLDYCRYPDTDIDDSESFAKYNPNKLTKDDWRRDNINQFVFGLYDMIKKHNPEMKLGTAPFGTYKNPPGGTNSTAYGSVFQDAAYWMQQGKQDVLFPQMYWGEDCKYSENIDMWLNNISGRQFVVGLANYKMTDFNKWPYTEITYQIETARNKGADGLCFFRTEMVVGPVNATIKPEVKKLFDELQTNHFKYPAHIPVMDYNGITKPNAPTNLTVTDKGNNTYEIKWDKPALDQLSTPIRYYCVYAQSGNSVNIDDIKNTVGFAVKDNFFTYTAPDNAEYTFAVTAFDNGYYESDPVSNGSAVGGIENTQASEINYCIKDGLFTINAGKVIQQVSIYSLSGQYSMGSKPNSENSELNISSLPKGVYIATVLFGNGQIKQIKIIN